MNTEKTYEIDRIGASKFLRVSTRTIDRYLRFGKLTAIKSRGRILLSKEELGHLKNGTPYQASFEKAKSSSIQAHDHDSQFYKDLYEETLQLLKDKEGRLEQAQYRIGQLESQATGHYPVKLFSQDANESHALQLIRQSLAETEQTNKIFQSQLKRERLNRTVVSVILYIILILQPVLWYFLRPGSGEL